MSGIKDKLLKKPAKKKAPAKKKKDAPIEKSFLIVYPKIYRPQFEHEVGSFPVTEMSRQEFKFKLDPEFIFVKTESIHAKITLACGEEMEVSGTVINTEGYIVSVLLTTIFDEVLLTKEQRFLLQRDALETA